MLALQVGLPDFLGFALGEADVVSELFPFAANVTGVRHVITFKTLVSLVDLLVKVNELSVLEPVITESSTKAKGGADWLNSPPRLGVAARRGRAAAWFPGLSAWR